MEGVRVVGSLRFSRVLLALALGTLLAAVAIGVASGGPSGEELIINGGFDGIGEPWQVSPSGTFNTVSIGENNSGAISLILPSAQLQQPVAIAPGASYLLSGRVVALNGPITEIRPRLRAYDANGFDFPNDAGP